MKLFDAKNYSDAIKYDNVNENYIYHHIKNIIENKENINFDDKEIQRMLLGLDKTHLQELNQINSNILVEDIFEKMKKSIFKIYELYQKYETINDNLINYCKDIYKKISYFMAKNKEELLLNQPITFDNNPNYLYLTILYLFTNEILINENNSVKIKCQINSISYLKNSIINLNKYTNDKKWNIIFYLLSAYKSLNLEHENILIGLDEDDGYINLNLKALKKEENNDFQKISSILIPKLFEKSNLNLEDYYKNKYDIYDSLVFLSLIKIDYLNQYNFYTPDFDILKEIIFDILNSNSIKEYLEVYLNIKSEINPYQNKEFYEMIWNDYVNFVKFRFDNCYAETFRQFSRIFFSAFPLLKMKMEMKYYRLFNYAFFVILVIHEFIGHLEKIFLFYFDKEYQVKTPEKLSIDFSVDEEFEEETKFLKEKYNNLIKKLLPKKTQFITKKVGKKNNKNEKKSKNVENEDNNNISLEEEDSVTSEEIEGGYNPEKMIFGLIFNTEIMTINQVLFILNKNNYNSLDNSRRLSGLYLSYEKAKLDEKDYVDKKNFSTNLLTLLERLNINEQDLKSLDQYLFNKYLIKTLIDKKIFSEENDVEKLKCQYRNIFQENKKEKFGCHIKRLIQIED